MIASTSASRKEIVVDTSAGADLATFSTPMEGPAIVSLMVV